MSIRLVFVYFSLGFITQEKSTHKLTLDVGTSAIDGKTHLQNDRILERYMK